MRVRSRADHKYGLTLGGKFRQHLYNAKRRKIEFDLTKEEFAAFWQKPCHYCGYTIHTIGLDRIDSDLGYFVENLVPCCRWCNAGKNNLSQESWINLCCRVAEKHSPAPAGQDPTTSLNK